MAEGWRIHLGGEGAAAGYVFMQNKANSVRFQAANEDRDEKQSQTKPIGRALGRPRLRTSDLGLSILVWAMRQTKPIFGAGSGSSDVP